VGHGLVLCSSSGLASMKVRRFGCHEFWRRVRWLISIGLSVLRQPANQAAAPKCHSPSPCWLPVLRRSTRWFSHWLCQSSGQPAVVAWCHHCLASWQKLVKVARLQKAKSNINKQGRGGMSARSESSAYLAYFCGVQNGPGLTGGSRGTPILRIVSAQPYARPLT
jgi:hypothetical protein